MSERLSAAMKFCQKRKVEMPKHVRKGHTLGGSRNHVDAGLWKLQEVLDKLNETIKEKWQ
jgi:hypothetical protein